jgi:acetaldehyde dehydrogenase (acetylating)
LAACGGAAAVTRAAAVAKLKRQAVLEMVARRSKSGFAGARGNRAIRGSRHSNARMLLFAYAYSEKLVSRIDVYW